MFTLYDAYRQMWEVIKANIVYVSILGSTYSTQAIKMEGMAVSENAGNT